MSTQPMDQNNFEILIAEHPLVFVDFWAHWCVPCKSFFPIYEQVASENPDLLFATVSLEKESQLAKDFNVLSIPHVMVFKEGIAIFSESGLLPLSALRDLVIQAKKADVSKIKAAIADGEQS